MSNITAEHLHCNWLQNPMGTDPSGNYFSWRLHSPAGRKSVRQTAYRILAATDCDLLEPAKADLWDSGKVESDETVSVQYEGTPVPPRTRAWWRVLVWDENGNAGEPSEIAYWETGVGEREDWQAHWIGAPWAGGPFASAPAPLTRKVFELPSPPVWARLYITTIGLFEAQLNGERVGQDELAPGWTEFRKRIPYHIYDVTGQLQPGPNALGVCLGDGWGVGHVEWRGRQRYADRPLLLASLHVKCEDGSSHVIGSDSNWKIAQSPIVANDLLMGEHIDARQEFGDWAAADFDDSGWAAAIAFPEPEGTLQPRLGPPVRVMEVRAPVSEPLQPAMKNGQRWLFDLGENIVGKIRLRVKGTRGTTVIVRYSEILDEQGEPYYENLRSAQATDYFTLAGTGEIEEFETRFTFHGFRYAEVIQKRYSHKCEIEALDSGSLSALVLYSEMADTGEFSCSNELVNQLQRNIVRSQKGNFLEVPTDCPQRDERLGWTGDAQIFSPTAAFNMRVAGFFRKWLADLRDTQLADGGIPSIIPDTTCSRTNGVGPVWADAVIDLPWTLYQAYGDRRFLEENYDACLRYMRLQEKSHTNYIRTTEGFFTPGDWLNLDDETPREVIGTACFAHTCDLTSKMAGVLGRDEEQRHYSTLREKIREAFQREYLDPNGTLRPTSETSAVLTLAFDLLPEQVRPGIARRLAEAIENRGWHTTCGFVGTAYLPHVLSANGFHEVAGRLLAQTRCPSYLYPVTQGATSIWERWDGWTEEKGFQNPAMNSFNHYAFGAIGAWLYQTIVGLRIDPAHPGYKRAIIAPRPGADLTRAAASTETPHGRLACSWELEAETFHLEIEIPPNTTATVELPESLTALSDVTINGAPPHEAQGIRPITATAQDHAPTRFEAGSGCFVIHAKLAN